VSIFGTSKPSIFEATAVITGISSSGASGFITYTLGTGHGFVAGDAIFVQLSSATAHNGVFTVASVTATQILVSSSATGSGTGAEIRKGYIFKNSTFDFDPVQPDQLNFRSVITGKKTNTHLGDYGTFRITERLWQNTSPLTASSKFQTLYAFYHTDIWFFPHSNKVVQDTSTNAVPCYFKSFKPVYFRNLINYDAVICEFETNSYHDITKLLA